MAPPPNPKTKLTLQELFNLSFDQDKQVLALELLGYDSGADALVRLAVDSNGVVQTDGSSTYAPIGATYVTLSTSSGLTNERVLTGTSNQVTVTDNGAGSTVVLSTPQNIHTAATPSFAGLTVNGTTSGLVSEVTGANGTIAADFIVDSSIASQPALRASNDTNFAHGGPIALLRMRNATDSGAVLSIENAGTGNYITADSAFTVAKSGLTTVTRNGLTTTSTEGVTLQNTTAATSGVQTQYSPALDLIGHSWLSIGGADRTHRFRTELRPASGSTSTLALMSSVDTGTPSWTDRLTLTSAGLLTTASAAFNALTLTGFSGAVSASAGVLSAGTLSVANGGTGITTLTANRIPYGNGTSAFQSSANLSFDGTTFMVGSANTNSAVFSAERSITSGSIRTTNTLLTITGANPNFPVANRTRLDLNSGVGGTLNVVTASDQSVIWNSGMTADVSAAFALNMDVGYNGSGGVSGALIGLRTAISIATSSSGAIANVVGWQSNFTHNTSTTTISNVRLINFVATGIQYNGGNITNYMYLDLESPSGAGSTVVTNMYGIRIRSMALGTNRYGIYFDGTGTTNGIYWGTTTLLYSSGAGTINATGIFAASSNITSGGSIAATTGVSGTTGSFSTSTTTPLVSPASGAIVVRGLDSAIGAGTDITVRGGDFSGMSGNGGNVIIRAGTPGTAGGTAGTVKVFEPDGTTEIVGLTRDVGVVINEGGESNLDFRVEGDTNTNLIFADASADAVGIGTGSPGAMLDVANDARARQLIADGSSGGTASTNTFTNGTDGVSGGTLSVFDSTATGLVHSGYIRIFVGTTEAWVPYMVSAG